MTTVLRLRAGPGPSRSSRSRSPSVSAIHSSRSRTLRKPGPATSGGSASGLEVDRARRPPAPARAGSSPAPWPGPCSRWPGSRRTWDRCSAGRPRRTPTASPPSGVAAAKAARNVRGRSWQDLRASVRLGPRSGSVGMSGPAAGTGNTGDGVGVERSGAASGGGLLRHRLGRAVVGRAGAGLLGSCHSSRGASPQISSRA